MGPTMRFRQLEEERHDLMPESQQPKGGVDAILCGLLSSDRVLDVGAGEGKWGRILDGKVASVDALEVWTPNVETLRTLPYYGNVIQCDAREFHDWGNYDAIILGDVLEHMPHEDAIRFCERIGIPSVRSFLSIPISVCEQDGELCGNPWESHLYQWDHSELYALGWRLLHVGSNDERTVVIGTYEGLFHV